MKVTLKVGSKLIALRDVSLSQAKLNKGSLVKVTHIARKDDTPVAVNLELKDGQILRDISYRKVLDNFTPASSK